jgi:hypothetical protein
METLTHLFGNDGLLSLNGPAGVLLGFAAWGCAWHLIGRYEQFKCGRQARRDGRI